MERASGYGGGARAVYADAATFGSWWLEVVGPGLYRLRAQTTSRVPPLLALPDLRLWIRRGAIVWEWTTKDGDVGVSADGVLEAIVGQPRIGAGPT